MIHSNKIPISNGGVPCGEFGTAVWDRIRPTYDAKLFLADPDSGGKKTLSDPTTLTATYSKLVEYSSCIYLSSPDVDDPAGPAQFRPQVYRPDGTKREAGEALAKPYALLISTCTDAVSISVLHAHNL